MRQEPKEPKEVVQEGVQSPKDGSGSEAVSVTMSEDPSANLRQSHAQGNPTQILWRPTCLGCGMRCGVCN